MIAITECHADWNLVPRLDIDRHVPCSFGVDGLLGDRRIVHVGPERSLQLELVLQLDTGMLRRFVLLEVPKRGRPTTKRIIRRDQGMPGLAFPGQAFTQHDGFLLAKMPMELAVAFGTGSMELTIGEPTTVDRALCIGGVEFLLADKKLAAIRVSGLSPDDLDVLQHW